MNDFPSITVRQANKSDIKQIARVAERAFYGKPDVYWATVGALKAQVTYVAEIDKLIVGVIEIEIVNLSNKHHGHIGYIFVDPDFRRRGIASKLIDVAENFFRENSCIASWALTDPENVPTRRLFANKGYVELTKEDVIKLLGKKDAKKLLRRMIYWEGDVILKKDLK